MDSRADPATRPTGVTPKSSSTHQPDVAPKASGGLSQSGNTDSGSFAEKELNDSHTRTEGNADIGDGPGISRLGKDQVSSNGSGRSGYASGSSNRTDSATRGNEARELAAFSKFAKTRIETGKGWRGFSFEHVDAALADNLNAAGASGDYELIKALIADGEVDSPVASGIIVRAKNTGRVLLLQRSA